MTVIRQVTFDSANRKKDRSVSMRFTTNLEQTTDEFMEMDKLINSTGVVVFSERSKLTTEELEEINKVEFKVEGKTKSQRLRGVLFVYWKQQNDGSTFEDYYAKKMDEIIEHFKKKLD